jgi:23S rRNA (adenine2030-N6)-methyltransferase
MKYSHGFHAGNFADVVKHLVLLQVLEALRRKSTAFFVLDTHAGRGAYELVPPRSASRSEHQDGIDRLLAATTDAPALLDYLALIRALDAPDNRSATLRRYPGSPLIIASRLREGDRATFLELNAAEARALRRVLAEHRNVRVDCADGYEAIRSQLPPPERRGLVFIDPPYELQQAEFERALQALEQGRQRWPTGIYALWYPIKRRAAIAQFHARLKATGMRKILCAELGIYPADSRVGLNGCGMIIVNPPFELDLALGAALPALHAALDARPGTRAECYWLVPE